MALTTDISLAVLATLTKDLDLGVDPSYPLNYTNQVQLASGTSAGQSDLLFTDQRTISASSSEDLDLAGGLTDAFGATLTFVEVTALVVKAAAGNTNNVVVGAAGSNQWATLLNSTGTVTLRPGALFAAVAGVADATGWAVTASTGDLLKVANSSSGSSVTYDIVIIGRSA